VTMLHRDVFSALIVPKLFGFVSRGTWLACTARKSLSNRPSIKAVSTMLIPGPVSIEADTLVRVFCNVDPLRKNVSPLQSAQKNTWFPPSPSSH